MQFTNKTEKLSFRLAGMGDEKRISELYKKIAITENNRRERLGNGASSFENRGGMLEISSEKEINARFRNPETPTLVGIEKGKILSMLWYEVSGENLFFDFTPNDTSPFSKEDFRKIMRDGAGYAKEIISTGHSRVMSYALYYAVLNEFIKKKLRYTVCEIFYINGYEDENGYTECNFKNNASGNFLKSVGAVEIGKTKSAKVSLDGFSVYKTPLIYLSETEKAAKLTLEILNKKGWCIQNAGI